MSKKIGAIYCESPSLVQELLPLLKEKYDVEVMDTFRCMEKKKDIKYVVIKKINLLEKSNEGLTGSTLDRVLNFFEK